MSKDPAFLFYDGDAARDVSHMNRLERGCYFDLIQAQRKFHGITAVQIRKVLGKDFDECWGALELILKKEGDVYFIEWVRESIEKRRRHSDLQRERIAKRWEKNGNTESLPKHENGNTAVFPRKYLKENENENEKKEGGVGEGRFVPPTVEEVRAYCRERRNNVDPAKFVDHYQANGWVRGKTKIKDWRACVRTWEQKTGPEVDNTPRKDPDPNCELCKDWTGKRTGYLMAQGTGKKTPCPCTEVK